eukprot:CAMPEP_0182447142 /NCGR_PEP_ID=MMETSP1172-20130603/11977_1 /TAXON_ID=708627 /ORGANISM="Timspurckia oligopyrenoides, Strain CCMP3278" /LENGTH=480 /DNA_ID=CAMNT_0024643459 /DNA_START=76 /DNA_END=1518 /DNA_ORIENTATION=-
MARSFGSQRFSTVSSLDNEAGCIITVNSDSLGTLNVPDTPIIPFIEGDGIGSDIWKAARSVFDAAVDIAYSGKRKILWYETYAGEKSFRQSGDWLPASTLEAFRKYKVGIKGPLTTPIGGGMRSLNVALRQELDLYTCLRPVRWFEGVPSPVKKPHDVDMVIFRENTEDIYAGIDLESNSDAAIKLKALLGELELLGKVRFPDSCGFGIKPISKQGSERLIRAAVEYALKSGRKSVTLVHKGNIMKYTEGAFAAWGYELVKREFRDETVTQRESWILDNAARNSQLSSAENAAMFEPGYHMMTEPQQEKLCREVEDTLRGIGKSHGDGKWKSKLMIKDAIADITLQQVLTRPTDFDVMATMNLNGDYLSDALAAQVGGIGIAPGGNLNYISGHAVFEATHGTAPKYAGLDKVNPGSVILSGELMLRYLGWNEAADLIISGLESTIREKHVTYDFHRLMQDAKLLKCSEFANRIVQNMNSS